MLTYDELPPLTEGGATVQSLDQVMAAAPGSSFHHTTTSARYMRDAEGWIRWDRSDREGQRRDRDGLANNISALPVGYVWDVHLTETEVTPIPRSSLPPINWAGEMVEDLDEVMAALPGSCFHHGNDRNDRTTYRYYRDEQGWVRYSSVVGPQRRTRDQLRNHGVGQHNYYWDVHLTVDLLDQPSTVDYSSVTLDNVRSAPVGAEFEWDTDGTVFYRKVADGSWLSFTASRQAGRPIVTATVERRLRTPGNTYHWRMATIGQATEPEAEATLAVGSMVGRADLDSLPVGTTVQTPLGTTYVKRSDGAWVSQTGSTAEARHFSTNPVYRITVLPVAEQEPSVSALNPGHHSPTEEQVASLPPGSAITGRGNWERGDWENNHFVKRTAGWCHISRDGEDRGNHRDVSLAGSFWTIARIGGAQDQAANPVPEAEVMPYIRAGAPLPERWAHELMTAMPVGAVCSVSGLEFEKRADGGWGAPGSHIRVVRPDYDGTRRDGWQLVSLPVATREEIATATPGAVVQRTHRRDGALSFARLVKQDGRWLNVDTGTDYGTLSITATYYWERKVMTDTITTTNTNTLSVGDYLRDRSHALNLPVGSQVLAGSRAVYTKIAEPNTWQTDSNHDYNGEHFAIHYDYNRVTRIGPDSPVESDLDLPAVGTDMTIALADGLPVGSVLRWQTGREWLRKNENGNWDHQREHTLPVFEDTVGDLMRNRYTTAAQIPCLNEHARGGEWTFYSHEAMPVAAAPVTLPAVGTRMADGAQADALPAGSVLAWRSGREFVRKNADGSWDHVRGASPMFDGSLRTTHHHNGANIDSIEHGWSYHSHQTVPGAATVSPTALALGTTITSIAQLEALPRGAVITASTGREYVKDSTGWSDRNSGARMAQHRFSLRGTNRVTHLPVTSSLTIGQEMSRSMMDELPVGSMLCFARQGNEQDPNREQLTKNEDGSWTHRSCVGGRTSGVYRRSADIPSSTNGVSNETYAAWRLKSLPTPHQEEIADLKRRIIQGTESSGDGYAAAREGGLLRVGVRPMPKHGDQIRYGSIFGLPAGSVVASSSEDGLNWGVYTWDGGDDVTLSRVAGTLPPRYDTDTQLTVIGVGTHTPPVYANGRELLRAVFAEQRRLHAKHQWCGQEITDLQRAGITEDMPLASDRAPEPVVPAVVAPVVGERVTFPEDTERVRALPMGSTLMSDTGNAYIRSGERDLVRAANLSPLVGNWHGASAMTVAFVAPSREDQLTDAF